MDRPTRIRYQQVDAFTDVPFKGNPAAVCVMDHPLDASQMQAIALEMNLAETAFLYPPDDQGARRIRWFTPTIEVPLCGHATLASGHVLLASGAASPIVLHSASGLLMVHADVDGAVRLDFPATPTAPVPPPPGLIEALGVERAKAVETGGHVMIVQVAAETDVQRARPNFTDLKATQVGDVLVLAVTAPADSQKLDFVSRVFAPWAGIDEDPVTGLAHTGLTPYWVAQLGRNTLRAEQISSRGGKLTVRLEGERVHLIGHSVTVAEGTMLLPPV
ncbi:MAG: PhzF family phenazine biosynthesis protein [Gemmatimonadota bacterium]|nr:MAG: PhzF family phenazine biosynthesis protein [Gemmatimonadota bacterium]